MKIELNKKEIMVVLDSLIQEIAFDDSTRDASLIYNKILNQIKIKEYEKIYL